MNAKPNSANNSRKSLNWILPALALTLTTSTRAEAPPSAVPFADIGARATADYQGDALGITATPDGARLRCGFQKLEGHATPEGLWIQSTKPGGGQLRLVAVAIGRDGSGACPCALTEAASSFRSGMSIVTVPQGDQAPLGATCTYGATSLLDMPLLTELETTFSNVPLSTLGRAGPSTLHSQPSTLLAATGQVSVTDKLVRFTRPGVTEEYSVSVDGVRQDFIIASPPLNPQPSTLNQSMRVELALSGARAKATASGAGLTLEGSGRTLAYGRLRVEDATGRKLPARLEVLSADRLAVTVADANATYPVRIDPAFSDADWVSLNPNLPGANGTVNAIAVDGSGNVYVGGTLDIVGTVVANSIAKWGGSTWSALGSGMIAYGNGYVHALAVSGTNLYAGGYSTTAGGVAATNIAKWDGRAWSAFSSGVDSASHWDAYVRALAVSGTNLYAGGHFTTAGDVAATNIAQWNGRAWSALGSGLGNDYASVSALALSGTDLYAAGGFSMAGEVPANAIAKWNGSAWSALGSGLGGWAHALAVNGTNLYAGGDIGTVGGPPANDIAKWDGGGWSPLGSGMDYAVNALVTSGTDLYAGGYFTTAGGVVATNIAKWDGSAWSALGSGMGGDNSFPSVYALAVSGTDLIAAGQFTTAGGVPANNVAIYHGGVWSALGSGKDGLVYALAMNGTDLYAGGWLPNAAGGPAEGIAAWNWSAWSALGSGLPGGTVWALAADGVGHLFVGGDFWLAGTNVSPHIAQANLGGGTTHLPSFIISSPSSVAATNGVTAEFQVEATGSPPLIYQWYFNGTNAIAGATSAVLTVTNVQLPQWGTYSVTVSNLYGTVTSAPALLFPRGLVLTNSEIALREAMTGGGTVTFACDGTITLASTITNVSDTVLDGSGHQVTISGNRAVRVFSVTTNVHFSVVNLTIADGTSLGGSAILNLGGIVNLNGVAICSNTAASIVPNDALTPAASGGAIFNRGGIINATNCSFTANSAQLSSSLNYYAPPVYGGAIYNEAGQLNLRACVFVSNHAFGAAASPGNTYPGAPSQGGAIYNSGTATLDLCTLAGNSANGGGGGRQFNTGLSGQEGSGGAIFNQGTLTVDRTTLCGNTTTGGGGGAGGTDMQGHGYGGAFGGEAKGGGICHLGSLCITRSTLVSNVVAGGWAGPGGPSATGSSSDGGAGGYGGSGFGGALLNAGQASLVNCTVAFNTGQGGGGGAGGYGVSGGAGGNGGYGFGGVDGTCNLTNCTLASNQGIPGPGGVGGQGSSGLGRSGTNGAAWGGTACGPMVNTLIAWNTPPGGETFPDPKLGPLANNGGPTLTMALLPGSPAIDAGNTSLAPTTDQRGFPRPAGLAADIGAFEYGSVVLWPPQVSTSLATGVSTNSATLNGTVNPIGWPTIAWFQWGATTNFGNLTPVTELGSGISTLPFSAQLAGLTPNVTYHFRIAATNDYGLAYGSDQSFTSTLPPDFTYTITNGTITITGYVGPGSSVAIPDTINGLPVTTIGASAFYSCASLTSVTIPNSVTSIGDSAFYYCTSLTNVTIPNSVISIGNYAFNACYGLTSVTIPNSVTSLAMDALWDCPNLAAITVDALNLIYSSVDGVLFNKSRTILTECPQGKGPSYTIPNGTTSIGEHAFYGCSSLTNVSIPNSVTSIGDYAFSYCISLTSITIRNGVSNIGDYAFNYCPSLTGVYFAGNAPSLGGASVFSGDNNATVYYLPGTSGWGTTFGGRPTALWFLPNPLILTSGPSFGVQSNAFGFIISWATSLPVVVEACTNPANHSWSPVQTNALTGGWSYFSDPQWANYAGRFYRVRWP